VRLTVSALILKSGLINYLSEEGGRVRLISCITLPSQHTAASRKETNVTVRLTPNVATPSRSLKKPIYTVKAVDYIHRRAVESVQKSSDSDSDSSIFKTPTPTPRFLKLRLRILDF
jgi:hypothetical protein